MNRRDVVWRVRTIVISAFLMLAAISAVVNFEPSEIMAVEPMATPAPPDPPGECFEWKTAGVQMIHKCVDEDEGIVCYAPTGGVLQCLVRN